jgi:glycine hydroxymethyltransferase
MILIGSDVENDLGVIAKKSGRTKRWSELIDGMVMPGVQGGPLMHVIAAKAAAFGEALTDEFVRYQKDIVENARSLAGALAEGGLRIVSGGTDNHLMLVDLSDTELTGKAAEKMLDEANITVNKNGIPFDTRSPLVTSGIRIGTPAVTTRGMGRKEMEQIADFILSVIKSGGDEHTISRVREQVKKFAGEFRLEAELTAAG